MIAPKSTVEKPLTVVDFIAHLEQCYSVGEVLDFGEQLPPAIAADERFIKAQASRCAAIVGADRKAAA